MQFCDGPYTVDGTGHPAYDVDRDGRRFLMINRPGVDRIDLVLNWFEDVRARAPTGQ